MPMNSSFVGKLIGRAFPKGEGLKNLIEECKELEEAAREELEKMQEKRALFIINEDSKEEGRKVRNRKSGKGVGGQTQISANVFWNYVDQHFKYITDQDYKWLLTEGKWKEYMGIPKRISEERKETLWRGLQGLIYPIDDKEIEPIKIRNLSDKSTKDVLKGFGIEVKDNLDSGDLLSAEIRMEQENLYVLSSLNERRKKALYKRVIDYLPVQEYDHVIEEIFKLIDQLYTRRQQRAKKKKIGEVKESGSNQESDALLKDLLRKRTVIEDGLGECVLEYRKSLLCENIYCGEEEEEYIKKKKAEAKEFISGELTM